MFSVMWRCRSFPVSIIATLGKVDLHHVCLWYILISSPPHADSSIPSQLGNSGIIILSQSAVSSVWSEVYAGEYELLILSVTHLHDIEDLNDFLLLTSNYLSW